MFLVDTFSRLPRMEKPTVGEKEAAGLGKEFDFRTIEVPRDEEDVFVNEVPELFPTICRNEDVDVMECFLNLPALREMHNPVTVVNIQNHQAADQHLIASRLRQYQHFPIKVINRRNLICYRENPAEQDNWKIYIPESLIHDILRWYHLILGHCGMSRLYDTVRARFHTPRLSVYCRDFVCSDYCHLYKNQGRGYGHTPPRQAALVPWNEVCIDLIGPWTIVVNGQILEFKALTSIDPMSNLSELIRIDNKSSKHVSEQFENSWLSRYPRPNRCVHDNGGEFIGHEFQELLAQMGIVSVPTTVKNPQANAICERMHQTVGDILRVTLHTSPPNNINTANQMMDNALATAMHALRCAVNATLQTSPGALVFNRDMVMDIPLIANLETIRDRRQQLINENLRRQNERRIEHHYKVGDKINLKTIDPVKLSQRLHGPFFIVRTNTNGTVTIQRAPNVQETLSIRKIVPYKGL